jgi:hypothetical protein
MYLSLLDFGHVSYDRVSMVDGYHSYKETYFLNYKGLRQREQGPSER